MRYLKIYEDFKKNNIEGSLITTQDIINCINSKGVVYATTIKNFVGINGEDNDPKRPLKAVSIDEDGLVTVEFEGKDYEVSLKDIESIEF